MQEHPDPTQNSPQSGAPEKAPLVPVNDVEANKDLAALSYVWVLSVFLFFARRDSPFVRFHARQGLILFLLSIPLWFIPFIGKFLELVLLAFAVIGFLGAAQGQWKELPLIGSLARRDKTGVRRSWREFTQLSARGWHEAKGMMQNDSPASPPSHDAKPPAPPNP